MASKQQEFSQSLQNPDSEQQQQDDKQIQKDDSKRPFGCPCGKFYLSYPALFTHIKQKHNGKAPGTLIKPKNQKARGRPRLPTINMQQDNSIEAYDCVEQLAKVIEGKSIIYEQKYQKSEGSKSCQDMGTKFIQDLGKQQQQIQKHKILVCFINYIRYFVKQKYEESYWQTKPPSQIIDISNQLVRQLENNKQRFPLDRDLLIDLLYILFRWMYKNKFTDHKLVRRTSQIPILKTEAE